jgi:hypothetical protein
VNILSARHPGYVCFSENHPMVDSRGVFLAFGAMAYDRNYAENQAILFKTTNTPESARSMGNCGALELNETRVAS